MTGLLALMAVAAMTAPAQAASKKSEAKGGAKKKHLSRAARAKEKAEAEAAALAAAKVAVFSFDGDDADAVRKHVVMALSNKGMKVDTSLRSPDTAEQFRDMGAALDLAVYVHGHVKELPQDHATATLTIRSAVSGRKVTTATFTGFRRGLPFDVEEQLWDRVSHAVTSACMEAAKPGARHHNQPMRIEAGTPL